MKKIFIIFVCFTMFCISCSSAPNRKYGINEFDMAITEELVKASEIKDAANAIKASKLLQNSDSSEKSYSIGDIIYDREGNAIAVVAGQVVENENNAYWFAVGLKRSGLMRWLNQNQDDETFYKKIASNISLNEYYGVYGDLDGSDNWGVILAEDSWRAKNGLFLAFEWANSYGNNYANDCEGWYLPTLFEYFVMWENKSAIDEAIEKAGGDVLSGYKYWTSSQDLTRTHFDAGDFNFASSEFDKDTSGWKTKEYHNCRAIMKLE